MVASHRYKGSFGVCKYSSHSHVVSEVCQPITDLRLLSRSYLRFNIFNIRANFYHMKKKKRKKNIFDIVHHINNELKK